MEQTLKLALLIWLVLWNIIAFAAFGLDKSKAKRKETNEKVRRIPEKTLFALAILGGSIGAILGMKVFHHKTKHWYFVVGMPLILILQIVLPIVIWYLLHK